MHRPNTHRTRLTPELLENKCTHPRMAQDALPSSTPFLSATKSTDRQADTHAALDGCVCTHCCMQLQMSLGSIFPFLPLSRHHPPVPICATIHNHFPDWVETYVHAYMHTCIFPRMHTTYIIHTFIHTIRYIALHCIALHHISLHCDALSGGTLSYLTLPYVMLHAYIHTYIPTIHTDARTYVHT